jgi:hypothetical protein
MEKPAAPAATDPLEPSEPTQPVPVPRALRSWWLWVMCLIGVDYFSSLAYQPSITYEVAGKLGPVATVLVVLITLFGLLPIYAYVVGQSPHGQGAFTLLERHLHGWRGKTIVLILLGFATTDFIMTKTLSLADAAEHTIHNHNEGWESALKGMEIWTKDLVGEYFNDNVVSYFDRQMMVTILLGVLGFVFWFIIRRGFNKRVIGLAVVVVAVYLLLTAVVVGSGLVYLGQHPEVLEKWQEEIAGTWRPDMPWEGWLLVGLLFLKFLPQLSLGLSGYEMSLVVMPQIKGRPGESLKNPRGRIRNTRKLLFTAALIMSVFLLGSVLVTTTLIPAEGFKINGQWSYRALAYLAHGGPLATGEGAEALNPLFGNLFGTIYDISTIVILCLAGTSVITSLQSLIPQFLLRFGMEQKWAQTWGVLFGIFALINLVVTVWFRASVGAQRGAYATGVLVSIASAGVLTVVDRWSKRRGHWLVRFPWGYGLITLVFVAMTASIVIHNPVGLGISVVFVVAIFIWSVISRAVRSDELRTVGFEFVNEESKFLWESMKLADFPALVPHRPGKRERDLKDQSIRQEHQLAPDMDIVFIEVDVEDPSEFYQKLLMEIFREEKRFVIRVTRCVSVAHAIAAVALELSKVGKPPCIHFGWSEISLLEASWSFFAFGEGNVPWKVRELILNEEPTPERRPRVVIG